MIKILLQMINENYFEREIKDIQIDNINKSSENTNNKSVWFDAMNERFLGRITLWESGSINAEILDVESMDTYYANTAELKYDEELISFLKETFKVMNETGDN